MRRNNSLKRYSLTGPEAQQAVEAGLADAEWFRTAIARKRMKELMRRSDGLALRDTAIWIGAMVMTGSVAAVLWPNWLAVPVFLVYGVLYGSAAEARRHESGHGTPFRTPWMNVALFQFSSFLMMRDPTVWRWQHTRHHTDTLIVGRDPEIAAMRPARLAKIVASLLGLVEVPLQLWAMVVHASGALTAAERTFIPETERSKLVVTARVWLLIYALVGAACVVFGSVFPVLLVGGPRVYGAWLEIVFSLTQHAGLGENVLDHRLNTRTILLSRPMRFLYWNMNYHVEHHMYPMTPYHRLPELHEEIKHDLAPVYPSLWAAYKEIVPAVLRQLEDQTYYVRRELPPGATLFASSVEERAG